METIIIRATTETPALTLDFKKGIFEIKGRSSLRYPTSFYQPILNYMEAYARMSLPVTIVNVHFEFVNNASTRWVYEYFKILEEIRNLGKTVLLKWHFETESQRKLGFHFQSSVNIPFKMISLPTQNSYITSE